MAENEEQLRLAIEAQRQREAEEFARERERLAEERAGRKPAKAIALSAEEARNAIELERLQNTQQKARSDLVARTINMGPEEAAAFMEEMAKAQDKVFKEQRDNLAREQQERTERQAELERKRGERER